MQRRLSMMLTLALACALVACAPEVPGLGTEEATSPTTEAAAPAATATTPMSAEPQTFKVQVDGKAKDYNSAFLAFFPQETSVHAGDTVEFQWVDTGEPHTVTFGGLVDDAVGALGSDPTAPLPPEWDKLPVLINDADFSVAQSAAQPCFLASGEPGNDACSSDDQQQTDFDGTESFYNSGWPSGAGTFTVTVAPDTKPGTYNFICLLHTPIMRGTINVVADGAEVNTPADQEAKGQEELTALVDQLTPAVDGAEPATPNDAFAGIMPSSPDVPGIANMFKPEEVTINAGESVTWSFFGPHLLAFNPPAEAEGLRTVADDGTIGLNMMGIAPAGGSPGMPAPPPEAAAGAGTTPEASTDTGAAAGAPAGAEGAMPPPTMVDGGEWNGQGYYNSGLFASFPPDLFAFKLTFTEPGSYPYVCLIHPGMVGTVTVK